MWVAAFGEAAVTWAHDRGPMTLLVETDQPLTGDERRRVERFVVILGRSRVAPESTPTSARAASALSDARGSGRRSDSPRPTACAGCRAPGCRPRPSASARRAAGSTLYVVEFIEEGKSLAKAPSVYTEIVRSLKIG